MESEIFPLFLVSFAVSPGSIRKAMSASQADTLLLDKLKGKRKFSFSLFLGISLAIPCQEDGNMQ